VDSISLTDTQISMVATMPAAIDQAERLQPGRYTVITGPQITGVLAHEAFGHTQEGDTRMLGRSCATHLQASGQVVGTPEATILSNAAVFPTETEPATGGGSFFFDAEGQLARPHAILSEGRVADPMNDLLSSVLGDANGRSPRQANGRRESWRRPTFARQTNTYFTPGEHTFEELVEMVDYGFLAEWAAGGMEDPKGMSLTAGTLFLREIDKGAITGRIFVGPEGGQVELSDPVPQLLQGLRAKSRDLELCKGGCNKYYKEILNVGIGGPHILWADVQCG
jgi:TldD protein